MKFDLKRYLENNYLSGELPEALGPDSQALEWLYIMYIYNSDSSNLSNNRLLEIPERVSRLTHLTDL